MQKTVKIPQVQHDDKIVVIPSVIQRKAPTIQTVQETVDFLQNQCHDPLIGRDSGDAAAEFNDSGGGTNWRWITNIRAMLVIVGGFVADNRAVVVTLV